MTALPPCACGHLHCLHIPAAANAGRCTGAGCDCRTYVRRTTLPDEHLPAEPLEVTDYTDDELRHLTMAFAAPTIRDLARLVLRERESHIERGERLIVAASELIRLADARDKAEAERDELREYNRLLAEGNSACLKEAHDELDRFRAALARVEAFADLCTDITAREIRDAIAGDTPPAAGYGADMGTNGPAGDTPRAGETTGTYVVDFEPGLYGPFPSRVAANVWAGRPINDGVIRSWTVRPVLAPAEVPHAAPSAPTHLPLDEVIEIAADLARRAATPPERTDG